MALLALTLLSLLYRPLSEKLGWTKSIPVCARFFEPNKGDRNSSISCQRCHAEETQDWVESLHAKANRKIDPALDRAAFEIKSHPQLHESKLKVEWTPQNTPSLTLQTPPSFSHHNQPEMVIGHENMYQYLLPFPGGRWQSLDPVYDPHKKEWFALFEGEKRQPHEWGHWSNRGMNWNSNCASCHMTNYNKGYDEKSDSYHSTWSDQGINCSSCHSSVKPTSDTKTVFNRLSEMDRCAACHSRREEITTQEKIDLPYNDQYRLELPTRSGVYYPDGQIRDEVFEWGSFKMSKMGHAGVSCMECHDPHSGKLRLPIENNSLCLSCHGTETKWNAPQIIPQAHTHHASGSMGNRCVECHMPETTYMKRDPRRDHGFLTPDPLLTKELGIPNACNRCHQDKSVDWAIQKTNEWHGDKMNRPEREKTRAVARAYQNDTAVVPELIQIGKSEKIALWRATLLELAISLDPQNPTVQQWSIDSLKDSDPLVRRSAIHAGENQPDLWNSIRPLLKDPVRSIRTEAAWILRREIDPKSSVAQELNEWMDQISDQPSGTLRKASYHESRGETEEAEKQYRRLIAIDPNSWTGYHELSRFFASVGKASQSLLVLEEAIQKVTKPTQLEYDLALIYAESGRLTDAEKTFQKVLKRDPRFPRALYNLGLLQNQIRKTKESIQSLRKAIDAEPQSPEAPYALATILFKQNQQPEAQHLLQKVLSQHPDYLPARQLLEQIKTSPK
ncbi:MAG: tetratricopeptide repeat protein [Verrucomicrobiota bacterium]